MTKTIAVLGATGNQGSSVVNTFLNEPGWKVRGITRDPSKDVSKALAAKGVEVVQADTNDTASLEAAFTDVHAIFAVTDFWAPFFNPSTKPNLKPGQTINQYCYDAELQHIKNIGDAAAKSDNGPLERFIWSGLSDAKKWSKGKYQWVYHFDSKAAGTEYIQQTHPALAKKMSIIQISFYASNAFHRIKKQNDGSYEYLISAPGDKKQPHIVTGKDTGPFVKALVQLPPGKNILAYGSMTSPNEFMKIWCEMNNARGHTRQLSLDEMEKTSPDAGREIGESSLYAAEFGFDGGDPSVLHPRDLGVEVPTVSIEDYIKGEDWSAVTGQSHNSLLR